MNYDIPTGVIAEMLTKETTTERLEVLERFAKEQDYMRQMYQRMDQTRADQQAQFAALPWWKRIGKHWWEM